MVGAGAPPAADCFRPAAFARAETRLSPAAAAAGRRVRGCSALAGSRRPLSEPQNGRRCRGLWRRARTDRGRPSRHGKARPPTGATALLRAGTALRSEPRPAQRPRASCRGSGPNSRSRLEPQLRRVARARSGNGAGRPPSDSSRRSRPAHHPRQANVRRSIVARAYREADAFVLPSFQRRLRHGVYAGSDGTRRLPVIATTAGAIPETVPPWAGLLAPPERSGGPGAGCAAGNCAAGARCPPGLRGRGSSGAHLLDWPQATESLGKGIRSFGGTRSATVTPPAGGRSADRIGWPCSLGMNWSGFADNHRAGTVHRRNYS